MGRVVWLGLGLAGWVLSGCNNACQDLCKNMADYAADCNFNVSDAEVDACIERQSAAEGDDLKTCRQFGDPETLRSQWTCQDLETYWTAGGAGDAEDGD